jgi:hypothetical protein
MSHETLKRLQSENYMIAQRTVRPSAGHRNFPSSGQDPLLLHWAPAGFKNAVGFSEKITEIWQDWLGLISEKKQHRSLKNQHCSSKKSVLFIKNL